MRFIKIKTRIFQPPKDDIYELFDQHLPCLREGDILLITTKILSIHEGRCVPAAENAGLKEKDKLAIKEVRYYIPRSQSPGEYSFMTINQNVLISAAGIDKSNANGHFILWPKKPQKLLKKIWKYLRKKYKLKKLGVIAVDSYSAPLRRGTLGIAVGFYGFYPTEDYRGKKDLFGRKLRVTKTNIVDSIATFGNLLMGESDERIPLLIFRGVKFLKFTNRDTYKDIVIPHNADMFYPLLKHMKKKK